MKLDPLISCATCLRATRDWQTVTLQIGGVNVWSGRCCRLCAVNAEDVLVRYVRESRAHAIQTGSA